MDSTLQTTRHDRDTSVLNADRLRYDTNVGPVERGVSIVLGGSLVGLALVKRTLPAGLVGALLGAPLLARGVIGHCSLYRALGINTAGRPGAKTRPAVLRG